jgi:hypothetical protein
VNWYHRIWQSTSVLWSAGVVYIVYSVASRRGEPALLEPFATVLSASTGTYVNAISTLAYWEEVGALGVFICSWSVVAWGTYYTVNWMIGGFRRY